MNKFIKFISNSTNSTSNKPSPEWTRFVCVSDTHNTIDPNKYKVPDGDVLLHSGDLTELGTVDQIQDTIDWIKSLPHKYKVIIAGNHDLTLDEPFYEKNWRRFHDFKEDSKEAINVVKNAGHGIVYLNDESFVIPDKGIHIWGSPWSPEFGAWAFNGQRGQFLKKKWEQIPPTTHILMTHGPPYGILDKTFDGVNAGCKDLLERVKEIRPYASLFGHIHEGYGELEKTWESTGNNRAKTLFINASTNNLQYKPKNAPIVFDFPQLS